MHVAYPGGKHVFVNMCRIEMIRVGVRVRVRVRVRIRVMVRVRIR